MSHSIRRRDFLTAGVAGAAALALGNTAFADDNLYGTFHMGVQSYTFRGLKTLDEVLARVKELGLKNIEFYPGHMAMTSDAKKIAEYKEKLAAAGITAMAYGVHTFGEDPGQNRKMFEFAKEMNMYCVSSFFQVQSRAVAGQTLRRIPRHPPRHPQPRLKRFLPQPRRRSRMRQRPPQKHRLNRRSRLVHRLQARPHRLHRKAEGPPLRHPLQRLHRQEPGTHRRRRPVEGQRNPRRAEESRLQRLHFPGIRARQRRSGQTRRRRQNRVDAHSGCGEGNLNGWGAKDQYPGPCCGALNSMRCEVNFGLIKQKRGAGFCFSTFQE